MGSPRGSQDGRLRNRNSDGSGGNISPRGESSDKGLALGEAVSTFDAVLRLRMSFESNIGSVLPVIFSSWSLLMPLEGPPGISSGYSDFIIFLFFVGGRSVSVWDQELSRQLVEWISCVLRAAPVAEFSVAGVDLPGDFLGLSNGGWEFNC